MTQSAKPIGRDLVRLRENDSKIHRRTCRYARDAKGAVPWLWAEGRPVADWIFYPWLKPCKVCQPDLGEQDR